MLILNSYPECGFGNRLLYFINLVQSAKKKDCGYFSTDFGGGDVLTYKLFEPDHKENEQYKPVLGDAFFENNKGHDRLASTHSGNSFSWKRFF